jgi:outer membrane immunogenic protein
MKKILLASVATGALALAGGVTGALTTADSANAADLRMPLKAPPPPAPVFSWSGCYVGANWGWGWGKKRGQGFYETIATGHVTPETFGTFNNTISGPLFGGQIGCNYQWPGSNFVIGVQGDYDAADINGWGNRGGGGANDGFHPPAATTNVKVDGLASVTGRIGWNGWGDPSLLVYFKGGWAWAHERDVIEFYGPLTNSRSGWTVGGGIEWSLSFAPRASLFVEYDYYDLQHNKNFCLAACNGGFTFEDFTTVHKLTVNAVKIGVNYKLWSPF